MAIPTPTVAAILAPMWKQLIESCPTQDLEILTRHIHASDRFHHRKPPPKPIGPRGIKRSL